MYAALLLFCFVGPATGIYSEVLSTLLKDYDNNVRPSGHDGSLPDGGPVFVLVEVYLRNLGSVDVVQMEFPVRLTLREQWMDERLSFGANRSDDGFKLHFITLSDVNLIWRPDTFFRNEKEARRHTIDRDNTMMRIYPDGMVKYSVRLSMKFACVVHLHKFPFDTQECFIDFGSYGYTSKDIRYQWKQVDPIQKSRTLGHSMISYEFDRKPQHKYCHSKRGAAMEGEYSCARIILKLSRRLFFYLIRIYFPSAMLVVVSWISFWIDRNSPPARTAIGVTTILAMVTQTNGVNEGLPPVAYLKAVDIWIGTCMFLIFAAFVEYAVIVAVKEWQNTRNSKPKKIKNSNRYRKTDVNSNNQDLALVLDTPATTPVDYARRIEVVCRYAFPATFLAFNIVYWLCYYVFE